MLLGVFPMNLFLVLNIFGEKLKKVSKEKNWAKMGPFVAAKGTLAAT